MGWHVTTAQVAVASVAVGAALTQAGVWAEHRRARRDARADRESALADASMARRRALTEEACRSLIDEMSAFRTHLHGASNISDSELQGVAETLDRLSERLPSKAARFRLERCSRIMWYADVVASDLPTLTAMNVAWMTSLHVSELAGALLREEESLPEPPRWFETALGGLASHELLDEPGDEPRQAEP